MDLRKLVPAALIALSPARVFRNAAFLMAADMASKGATGILAILIARYLGLELYGEYASAAAVCGIALMVTAVGFEQEFTRRGGISRDKLGASFVLNMGAVSAMCLLAYVGAVLFLLLGPYKPRVVLLGAIMGGALAIARLFLPFRHLSLILQRAGVTAVIQGISTLALVILTLVVIFAKGTLLMIVFVQLAVSLATLVVWFIWLPRTFASWRWPAWRDLAHFVRLSLPYGVSGFIWAIYFNFDALMLSLIRTESEVGLYAGVFRIVAISYIVGYALANTFTPLLFNAFHNNRSSYVHHARLLGASVSVLAVGVASVLFIFAEQLIDLLLGPAYLEAAEVMRVLSAAAFFRIVNAGLCELLTTSNQQRKRVNWEFALLLANIILNAILIPRWGGIGAAIATLSAEAVLLAGIAWVCYQSNLFTTAMATEAR